MEPQLTSVLRNHFHYQTEKHMKIILFRKFIYIKDIKVLKDEYQESLAVATLSSAYLNLLAHVSLDPFYMKKILETERSKTNLTWNFAIEQTEKEEIIFFFFFPPTRARPLLY